MHFHKKSRIHLIRKRQELKRGVYDFPCGRIGLASPQLQSHCLLRLRFIQHYRGVYNSSWGVFPSKFKHLSKWFKVARNKAKDQFFISDEYIIKANWKVSWLFEKWHMVFEYNNYILNISYAGYGGVYMYVSQMDFREFEGVKLFILYQRPVPVLGHTRGWGRDKSDPRGLSYQ